MPFRSQVSPQGARQLFAATARPHPINFKSQAATVMRGGGRL